MKNNLPLYGAALLTLLASVAVIGFVVIKILSIKNRKRRGKYRW